MRVRGRYRHTYIDSAPGNPNRRSGLFGFWGGFAGGRTVRFSMVGRPSCSAWVPGAREPFHSRGS